MIQHLFPFLKNIKAGPKTTILGSVLIAVSLYLIITADQEFMKVIDSGLLVLGVILLFLKDYKNGKDS